MRSGWPPRIRATEARPVGAGRGQRWLARPTGRRLSAILFADIVGYTRLMAADEGATFARLNHIRHAILEPLLSRHGGRLVKPMGDGMLTDFVSVVDAVAFATAFQQAVADLDHTATRVGSVHLSDRHQCRRHHRA